MNHTTTNALVFLSQTDPYSMREFGPWAAVLGIVIVGFGFLLKWVLNHTDTQSRQHAAERADWRAEMIRRDEILVGLVRDTNVCISDNSATLKQLRKAVEDGTE